MNFFSLNIFTILLYNIFSELGGGGGGVLSGVACIVTPTLAPTTIKMQEAARRASLRKEHTPTNEKFGDLSKQVGA